MKNSSHIITILLSVLFFGYIFYTYKPVEKIEQPAEKIAQGVGLWGIFGIDLSIDPSKLEESKKFGAKAVTISDQADLDLIINMMREYNNLNTAGVVSFFSDSCDIIDLNGKAHIITHQNFETFFNNLDSVTWHPLAIIPLKLKEYSDPSPTTSVIVHSVEARYKKDGSLWAKDLLEVFYIQDGKIQSVNQYGKEKEDLGDDVGFLEEL
tara:strand:- start:7 stop:633 length:627 start_codon:yes stop_codon:yes gene_type:complete